MNTRVILRFRLPQILNRIIREIENIAGLDSSMIRDNQFHASSKRGGAFPERPSARVRSFSSLSFLQVIENKGDYIQ